MNILMRYLGYLLLISALFRVVPIITGLIYGESIATFMLAAFVSVVLGLTLLWLEKRHNPENSHFSMIQMDLPNALILIALSFIILPLIGTLSYLPTFNYNFLDAFFESISGFTTTGLTLFNSMEGLPKSLLIWRAETQWIGGMGIIMVFLFIISRLSYYSQDEETQIEATSSLYQAQGFEEKIEPSLKKSSKNILLIYSCYTLAGISMLYLTGMGLFESISLSFTSISTGGFIVTDTLNATNLQLVILSVLMLLGSISFIVHNQLLKRKFKEFIFSFEKNLFLLFIIISSALTLIVFTDLKVVLFELISAFTTTGYSLGNISAYPPLFIMLIMTGMLVGGSVSSTSGGLKVSRVYSLISMVPWMLKKLSSPRHAIIPFKIRGQMAEENDLLLIAVYVVLFFSVLSIGTILFLILGYGFLDSSFQMASALGTVGLQTIDLTTAPAMGKIILIIAMLLGRLEIFPLLILMRRLFRSFYG
jgi:trk system potassium uptake protein